MNWNKMLDGNLNEMKTAKILGLFLVTVAIQIQSCNTLEDIENPVFDAYVDNNIYTAGDTVRINFKGNIDYITLYTGKPGNNYDFTDKTRFQEILYYLDFNSHARDGAQGSQVSILVSDKFDGNYNYNNILSTEWTDISERFKIAKSNERDYMSSGIKSINDAIFKGNEDTAKVYFAIRQIVKKQSEYGRGSINRIQNFRIRTQADINSDYTNFYAYSSFGFNANGVFSSPNKQSGTAGFEGTNIIILRNNSTLTSEETQDWIVSDKMAFPRAVDVGPDWGLPIKSMNDRRLDYYQVAYDEPGDYKIVLIAFNANSTEKREVKKEINIKVLPK